jgi:Rps23 Pro-64 3,4-dihydroxylase Tpa1-like proline 4-hydroxylase
MALNEIFNHNIFSVESKKNFHKVFNNNTPIRHVVIDNFLDNKFGLAIHENFPSLSAMKTHYHGLNEQKSEDSNFEKLESCFTVLHEALSSELFLNWIQEWTGISHCAVINDRLGYGLHQGGNNSFLDIHIDYNIHPIQKLYRKLNLILFFNPDWEATWGGHLELWDSEVKNCIQSITPVFNRCVIFECSDVSYHGYSRIAVPEGTTRKSYYQYYFTPIPAAITYHDTVFKTRPKESFYKKIATPVKELAKNTAKRILLKTGMKKFLK